MAKTKHQQITHSRQSSESWSSLSSKARMGKEEGKKRPGRKTELTVRIQEEKKQEGKPEREGDRGCKLTHIPLTPAAPVK